MKPVLLTVGAALQSWTIVFRAIAAVAGVGVALLLLVGLFGLGSQGWLAGLIVLHLACEHDVAQTRFDGVKFRSRDDVFILVRKDARDFLLCQFDTLRSGRMRGEELGNAARAAFLVSLDTLEKGYIGVGIVACFVHV